jgi:hypothetical protein
VNPLNNQCILKKIKNRKVKEALSLGGTSRSGKTTEKVKEDEYGRYILYFYVK